MLLSLHVTCIMSAKRVFHVAEIIAEVPNGNLYIRSSDYLKFISWRSANVQICSFCLLFSFPTPAQK